MSCWPRPTTADIGARTFAATPIEIFNDTTLGMLSIISHDECEITNPIAQNGVWNVEYSGDDIGLLLVRWLDEVLYQLEVNERWLIQMSGKLEKTTEMMRFSAQVSWIQSDLIQKEIEIKAVTTHELEFRSVSDSETIVSHWPEVPSFDGPGWYCDVVFDI